MFDIFREIILQNELGGDLSLAYRFSDPDGVNSGKSGWSFGICQFDTQNNGLALLGLREAEFSISDIRQIIAQTCNIERMDEKLEEHKDVVDGMDRTQLQECLDHPKAVCGLSGVEIGSDEALLHLADYHNQFYLSTGGQMHRYLKRLGRPVVPQDIYDLKITQKWGKKRPDDVLRRFQNIIKVLGKGVKQ